MSRKPRPPTPYYFYTTVHMLYISPLVCTRCRHSRIERRVECGELAESKRARASVERALKTFTKGSETQAGVYRVETWAGKKGTQVLPR